MVSSAAPPFLDRPALGARLFGAADVARVDAAAAAAGEDGWTLMRRAGEALAARAPGPEGRAFYGAPAHVLAGPGKNGGDGFVAAAALAAEGRAVQLFHLAPSDPPPPESDVGRAIAAWRAAGGAIRPLAEYLEAEPREPTVVIDALFGVGLSRPLAGIAAAAVEATLARRASGRLWVVAADLPSGLDAETGRARGLAAPADATVTFVARRPGMLLAEGPALCGHVAVAAILRDPAERTAAAAIEAAGPATVDLREAFVRDPETRAAMRRRLRKSGAAHKYDHGHALVLSGGFGATGAARLAARAAARVGAGLVTLGAPAAALPECAAQLTSVMLTRIDDAADLAAELGDRRISALALGPGLSRGIAAEIGGRPTRPRDLEATQALVLKALGAGRATALDADALTAFEGAPDRLFGAISAAGAPVVVTPHAGEFARLFPDLDAAADKLGAARAAAARSGATVLLKGADTVVADPVGWAGVLQGADGAGAWLATAGSGDVLLGVAAGLLARGANGREAASLGAWLHLDAVRLLGPGVIAEDLTDALRSALGRALGD